MELQHLPNEVKILIFSLLDPNERLSVARTCRNLSDIIEPIMYTSFVVCFSRYFLCFGRRFVALEHILLYYELDQILIARSLHPGTVLNDTRMVLISK